MVTKTKSLEFLQRALDTIPELRQLKQDSYELSPEFQKWRRDTEVVIRETFDDRSRHVAEFDGIDYFPRNVKFREPSRNEFQAAYEKGLQTAETLLHSMLDEIKNWWDDEQTLATDGIPGNNGPDTNEIFIVHGRDDGAREKVARFLEQLALKPVVLHEQPNKGRTIIEKFEDYAHVGFAVVLLTPDDIGRLQDGEADCRSRARQNVVFEFGYFIGKLGREHVCALVKGDLERPSDYDGVLYIPLDDSSGWEMKLIGELKSVGYDIDANKAFAT